MRLRPIACRYQLDVQMRSWPSKKRVIFFTGIALINKNENLQYSHIDITTISFRDFNNQMLKDYLDSEDNLNTTAGVKIESRLSRKLIYKIKTEDEIFSDCAEFFIHNWVSI